MHKTTKYVNFCETFCNLNSDLCTSMFNKKLDGVAPLIADPPPLKLHQ